MIDMPPPIQQFVDRMTSVSRYEAPAKQQFINNAIPGQNAFLPQVPVINKDLNMRQVPTSWKPAIEQVYASNPKLPRGLLEATLMNESSMGTDSKDYKAADGESAWLTAFQTPARTHLQQKGIPMDLNTQAGVIKAMGDYYALRQNNYNKKGEITYTEKNPQKLYQRYNTEKRNPTEKQRFINMVNMYAMGTTGPPAVAPLTVNQ